MPFLIFKEAQYFNITDVVPSAFRGVYVRIIQASFFIYIFPLSLPSWMLKTALGGPCTPEACGTTITVIVIMSILSHLELQDCRSLV